MGHKVVTNCSEAQWKLPGAATFSNWNIGNLFSLSQQDNIVETQDNTNFETNLIGLQYLLSP